MELSAMIAARNLVLRDGVAAGSRASLFSLFRWEGYEGFDTGFEAAEVERDRNGKAAQPVRRMP